MKRQPCSWHIAIHGVCLVLVLIRYVNAQSQCNCLSSPGGSGTCQSCDDGCYLFDNRCYKCPDNCITCSSTFYCGQCQTGFYRFRCEYSCSTCKNRQCSKTNCLQGCVDGYYQRQGGAVCEKCRSECDTCNSHWTCTTCKQGYYGPYCQYACSICKDNTCYKNNGYCINGCLDYYYPSINVACCPSTCTSCDNYYNCTNCTTGYYGTACDEECSFHCGMVNNTRPCYKNTAECLVNCRNGYRGAKCDVPCEAGCQDGCDRDTGTCDRCKALYFGPSCEYTCNSACYNPNNGSSVCDKQTGTCSLTCAQPMCESLELDQSVESVSHVTTPVIIGVAGIAMCIMGIVIFVLLRRKRRNTSDAEQTNEALQNNPDTVYSVLDHADQGRTTDYTALHTLRGQPQEVQVISSPATDGNNATYVNAEDTSKEPAKDSYENVFK